MLHETWKERTPPKVEVTNTDAKNLQLQIC